MRIKFECYLWLCYDDSAPEDALAIATNIDTVRCSTHYDLTKGGSPPCLPHASLDFLYPFSSFKFSWWVKKNFEGLGQEPLSRIGIGS